MELASASTTSPAGFVSPGMGIQYIGEDQVMVFATSPRSPIAAQSLKDEYQCSAKMSSHDMVQAARTNVGFHAEAHQAQAQTQKVRTKPVKLRPITDDEADVVYLGACESIMNEPFTPKWIRDTTPLLNDNSPEDEIKPDDELDALISFAVHVSSEKLHHTNPTQNPIISHRRQQPSVDDFPSIIKVDSTSQVDLGSSGSLASDTVTMIATDSAKAALIGGRSHSSIRREQYMIRRLQMNQYSQRKKTPKKNRNSLFKASLPRNEIMYEALLAGVQRPISPTMHNVLSDKMDSERYLDAELDVLALNMKMVGGASFQRRRDLQLRKFQGNKLKGEGHGDSESDVDSQNGDSRLAEQDGPPRVADSTEASVEMGTEDESHTEDDDSMAFLPGSQETALLQDDELRVNSLVLSPKCQDMQRTARTKEPVAFRTPISQSHDDEEEDDDGYTGRVSIAPPRMSVDVRHRKGSEDDDDNRYTGRMSIAAPRMSIDVRHRPKVCPNVESRPATLLQFDLQGCGRSHGTSMQSPPVPPRISLDIYARPLSPRKTTIEVDQVSSPSNRNQARRGILAFQKKNASSPCGVAESQLTSSSPPARSPEKLSSPSIASSPTRPFNEVPDFHEMESKELLVSPRMSVVMLPNRVDVARIKVASVSSSPTSSGHLKSKISPVSPRMGLSVRPDVESLLSEMDAKHVPLAHANKSGNSSGSGHLRTLDSGHDSPSSQRMSADLKHAAMDSGSSSIAKMRHVLPQRAETVSSGGSSPILTTRSADFSNLGSNSSRTSSAGSDLEALHASQRIALEISPQMRTSQRLGVDGRPPPGSPEPSGRKERHQLKTKLASVVAGYALARGSSHGGDRGDPEKDGFTLAALVSRKKGDEELSKCPESESSRPLSQLNPLHKKAGEPKAAKKRVNKPGLPLKNKNKE